MKLLRWYPNCISTFRSLQRNDIYTVESDITYCPKCEDSIQRELKYL
jgi:hypothetical protein